MLKLFKMPELRNLKFFLSFWLIPEVQDQTARPRDAGRLRGEQVGTSRAQWTENSYTGRSSEKKRKKTSIKVIFCYCTVKKKKSEMSHLIHLREKKQSPYLLLLSVEVIVLGADDGRWQAAQWASNAIRIVRILWM